MMNPKDRVVAQTWLTPAQATDYIPVGSEEAVRGLIRDGSLRAVNVSRGGQRPRYRIRREWIDAWLEERVVAT